jgi:hypothetical protein
MELREYFFKNYIKITQFAKKIGYSHFYLYDIVAYRRSIGKKLGALLINESRGEFSQADVDEHNAKVKKNA